VSRLRKAAWLLLPLVCGGATPLRYNDAAPAVPRAPLVRHIEELALKLAGDAHRPPLKVDPRLEAAAADIARRAPLSGPPPNELVQAALWLHGIVEPPPQLIVVSTLPGADEAPLLDVLRGQLPRILAAGGYRRAAAAAEPVGDQIQVVVALQESYVELEPVPRALPAGGAATVRGKLRPPYVKPEVLVTAPGGQVTPLFVAARDDITKFQAAVQCLAVGRHQVEIVADDRFGPTVLANFPVDCGVPAPSQLVTVRQNDAPVHSAAEAEAALFRLVQADRAHAGLPPLAADPALSQVARAHSEDMVRSHFFGHVSPRTGSAADRIKTAHLQAQLVLENVARAYSPGEAERGLMDSPGHRANLLNKNVDRLGIGVALGNGDNGGDGDDVPRELFVTQLFIRAPEPLPAQPQADLKRRIAELRRTRSLPPLGDDAELDQIAAETAAELARRGSTDTHPEEALMKRSHWSQRYKALKSVAAAAVDLPQAMESLEHTLVDAHAVAVGVGVGRGADSLFVVLLIGNR
jgi:uncharacterized protein YkwD